MKKLIWIALIFTACDQNKPDTQVRRIEVYQMGKLIKVDTAVGWIRQNGYLGTLDYTRKNGSSATVKGDYIITPIN